MATVAAKNKPGQQSLFTKIDAQSGWLELLDTEKGLIVADVYNRWCGPCTTFDVALQKLNMELKANEWQVKFVDVQRDFIEDCENIFRTKSCRPLLAYFCVFYYKESRLEFYFQQPE